MKYRMSLVLMLLLASSVLVACNTTKGIGQDIQKAGEVLEDSAEKTGAKKD